MTPTRDEFIDLLNRDLRLEYLAVIQYTQHFGMLSPLVSAEAGEQIQNLAGDELAHALILAEQIRMLGGEPEVRTPRARSATQPLTMLEFDRQGEDDTIARYRDRIDQAEALGLDALAHILRLILAVEERHLKILQKLMGQLSS